MEVGWGWAGVTGAEHAAPVFYLKMEPFFLE